MTYMSFRRIITGEDVLVTIMVVSMCLLPASPMLAIEISSNYWTQWALGLSFGVACFTTMVASIVVLAMRQMGENTSSGPRS